MAPARSGRLDVRIEYGRDSGSTLTSEAHADNIQVAQTRELYLRCATVIEDGAGRVGEVSDGLGYEEDVQQLYQEASHVRAQIEQLWLEAQVTDAEMKGAVSAAQIHDLSDSERDFAVSFGLQNAEKWRKLSDLSLQLGDLIEKIETVKAGREGEHPGDRD